MSKNIFKSLICFLLFSGSCAGNNSAPQKSDHKKQEVEKQQSIRLEKIAEGLTSPVDLAVPGDNSGRLFIVQQNGYIKIIKNGKVLEKPFLDVSRKLAALNSSYSEMGLLGLAFHPHYFQNGRFFIYYSTPATVSGADHTGVLAEYTVSATNPDVANPASERIILTVPEPRSNHNGGDINFGPDGFLYLGLGDGGGGGDRFGETGNGQNINTLLGSILRIDIDGKKPYAIPGDNPFAGKDGRDEIYAYGLRNPWRFSFDSMGRLFCGDVGQNVWEEVDIIEKGKNYGWRLMEGFHCYNPSENCQQPGLVMPVYEYSHGTGMISITGGYFYEGRGIPWLKDHYVFADWTGPILAIKENNGRWDGREIAVEGNVDYGYINSFGRDEDGELYILTQTGTGPYEETGVVYKLID